MIERDVTFAVDGLNVIGTLTLPSDASDSPVVLMLHGFTGTRRELAIAGTEDGVFSRTARLLAEAGYASLRIDFRGSGDSEGRWEDTTFSGQIKDAIAAVDYLSLSDQVDGTRISVIGWSQGGLIAAHLAEARPEINSVTLWAPVSNPFASFTHILGKENVDLALASPADTAIPMQLSWGAAFALNASYFHELATTSPVAAVAHYPGPLQVIACLKDEAIVPQPGSSEAYLRYHRGEQRLDSLQANHGFNAETGPETVDRELVPLTLDWIKRWNPVAGV